MEKNIKVSKDEVVVSLKLAPWKPGVQKIRYYEENAREWVKEAHPKLVLGKTLKPCVVRNQGAITEGEWIFAVVQEEVKKPIVKKAKPITKKEVASVKSSDRTDRTREG